METVAGWNIITMWQVGVARQMLNNSEALLAPMLCSAFLSDDVMQCIETSRHGYPIRAVNPTGGSLNL